MLKQSNAHAGSVGIKYFAVLFYFVTDGSFPAGKQAQGEAGRMASCLMEIGLLALI